MKKVRFYLLATLFFGGLQTLQAQPEGKKILVEKITSVGCPGCAFGGFMLDSLSGTNPNIIPVAIHRHDFWHQDSMRTADGDAILDDYLWAHPTAMVDRYKWPQYQHTSMVWAFWQTMFDDRGSHDMVATIGGATTYDANSRVLDVDVNGTILWETPGDIRVNAYLVESPVTGFGTGWDQLNGHNTTAGHPMEGMGDPIVGYHHKWVVRDMLGDDRGATAGIPNPAPAGYGFTKSFQTTLESNWDADSMYVVVLIQRDHVDPDKRVVFNCAKVDFNSSVAAFNTKGNLLSDMKIYPNPNNGEFNILMPSDDAWELRFVDVTGRQIKTAVVHGHLFSADADYLPKGIHFVELLQNGERQAVKKMISR